MDPEIRYIEVPLYLQMLLGICRTPRKIWKQKFKPIYYFLGGGGRGEGGREGWANRAYYGRLENESMLVVCAQDISRTQHYTFENLSTKALGWLKRRPC